MSTFCEIQLLYIHSEPILEYATTIWSPHLQYQIHEIEKVQCSAALALSLITSPIIAA